LDGQRHLAVHPRERPEVGRQDHPDHVSDWTSTDRTAGRSRTIGIQLSPPSAEPYTWPPVVPKYTPQGSSESTAIASRSTFTKQLLCGNPFVNSCHSLPPLLLRYTR